MEFESTEKLQMVYETLKNIETLDELTNKELLPTYPAVEWKKVMGARDIMAHHYFEVDADAIFSIIKNDLEPLKKAIDYFKEELFGNDNH